MDDDIEIEEQQIITHSLLHDLKDIVIDLENIKDDGELLKQQFKSLINQHEHICNMLDDIINSQIENFRIPYRCPVCNGTTFHDEGGICSACDGRGIVWC